MTNTQLGATRDDLHAAGRAASLKRGRADAILAEVLEAVRDWARHAADAAVPETHTARIASTHRLDWP